VAGTQTAGSLAVSGHPGVKNGNLSSAGAVDVDIAHNLLNTIWRIHQVSVNITGGGVCSVSLVINGLPHTSLSTGSTPLAASNPPPIDIGGHDTLTVRIVDGPASVVAIVSFYYEELPA
jgi:hypothetical protein